MSWSGIRSIRWVFMLVLFFAGFARSQENQQPSTADGVDNISLQCFVDNLETPVNRTVQLVVRLKWTGNLQRFDILPLDNPILQNFDIIGSGSTNTVSSLEGEDAAIREYTFELKPQSMGMGYVEPILIKYTDLSTDFDNVLTSNRIAVKITSPVIKGRYLSWLVPIAVVVVFLVIALFIIRFVLAKKAKKEKEAQENAELDVPIEEKFLQELQTFVDLNDPNYDGVKVLSAMTRLLRRYLHEKFAAPGFEATTGELSQYLYEKKFDDNFVKEIKELLAAADVVKFSGKSISRVDVEKSYGIVANTFRKGKENAIKWSDQSQQAIQEQDVKRSTEE